MPPELRNKSGQKVRLLKPLTRAGGEGQVFEIEGQPSLVAKLYHQPPDPQKAAKLAHQAGVPYPAFKGIAAWPTDLLLDPANRNMVRGILMPRMGGKEIHKLYGPADRSSEFPKAQWDFLVHVAMNCAAVFDTLHENGVIMADVNEGNLLVSESDGRIALIDCDSYQIANGNSQFVCDVGIPMWTPPELQGRNFRGLARTPNHDRFGLAVLIFRLLFMGRHPFAGIPTGRDQFEVEEAIKRCLFAFSPKAWPLGVRQPPHTLSLTSVPEKVKALFERAFLPLPGQPNARPTAREWARELKALGASLKKGCIDPGHKYWNGLASCPWCNIANAGGPNFFISVAIHIGDENWISDFNSFWKVIEQVMQGALMHEQMAMPNIGGVQGRPMPLSRPQPPAVTAPVMPSKPSPLERIAVPSPQLPERPLIRPPRALIKVALESNERLARSCGLGSVCFAVFAVLCQIEEMEMAKFGAASASLICLVTFISTVRRALKERQKRREIQQNAAREERLRAEEDHQRALAEYESDVANILKRHAEEVARADAEHQYEWIRQDQEYQKQYNAYLAEQRTYETAQQQFVEKVTQWNAEVDQREQTEAHLRQILHSTAQKLAEMFSEYQSVVNAAFPALDAARQQFQKTRTNELADMRTLHNKREELQLRQFLAQQQIRDAEIPNIGGGRKATLAAYNYCTAADLQQNMQIPGFGEVLIGNLLVWKRQCEGRFRYNANTPLPVAEVNAVKMKYAQMRQHSLAVLREGSAKLQNLESKTRTATSQAKMDILNLARKHAQASADLAVCH